jgi:hypothetical protein
VISLYRIHFTVKGTPKSEVKGGTCPEDAWGKILLTWTLGHPLLGKTPYPWPEKLKFVREETIEVYPEHPPVDGRAAQAECDALRATIRFDENGMEIL